LLLPVPQPHAEFEVLRLHKGFLDLRRSQDADTAPGKEKRERKEKGKRREEGGEKREGNCTRKSAAERRAEVDHRTYEKAKKQRKRGEDTEISVKTDVDRRRSSIGVRRI